jgi:hypothetical protein
MNPWDSFPLEILEKMRERVAHQETDEDGRLVSTVPSKVPSTPYVIKVDRDAYLAAIDAAIARRTTKTAELRE